MHSPVVMCQVPTLASDKDLLVLDNSNLIKYLARSMLPKRLTNRKRPVTFSNKLVSHNTIMPLLLTFYTQISFNRPLSRFMFLMVVTFGWSGLVNTICRYVTFNGTRKWRLIRVSEATRVSLANHLTKRQR